MLAWHQGSGMKGQNPHWNTGAAGRGKQGVSECEGSAELQFSGGLLPLHPLLPLWAPFHLFVSCLQLEFPFGQ